MNRKEVIMKIRTNIKAGGIDILNHNEKLVSGNKSKSLTVKTGVKAGGSGVQHNEKLVSNINTIEQKGLVKK